MGNLYETISLLCEKKGITGYRMCKDVGIQPSIVTDLKSGRKKGLSAEIANKIANYFGVSVGYLLGTEQMNEDGSFSGGSGFGGGWGSGAGFGDGSGYGGPLPEQKETPPDSESRQEDLKIALFGGDGEVTDEMWEEAVLAAEIIKARHKRNREKK